MSINTYATLQTAVGNWLDRSDLTTRIPEFISLAESRIANEVRCRTMFKRVTASISTEYFDAPSDMLEIKDIQINSDPIQPLSFLSPKALSEKFPSSTTGKPRYYTVIGDEIQVKPIPATAYTAEIAYYSRFTAFSADADTNWLLTNHPGIYLYATLGEAAAYLEDDALLQKYASLYEGAVEGLNSSERRGQYGAVLSSRVSTPTP